MPGVSSQLIVFSYHKSGTSLLLHVMTKISERLGFTLVNHFGLVDRLDPEADVVLLPHSLMTRSALSALLDRPYRAIRMIRDPRDIWVSGYLYHRRCVPLDEEWCTNTDLDPTPPILWPRVDHSFEHLPEDWKRRYLERLNGKSYQQNLLDRSLAEGLNFELEGYTSSTLAAMREWKLNGVTALDVRLEDVMADYDGAMLRIFRHFGFSAEQSLAAVDVARSEDIRRMDEATLAARPQIHSRVISKWREALSPAQVAAFEAFYGDLILELGYEPAGGAPGVSHNKHAAGWFTGPSAPIAADEEAPKLIWPRPSEAAADLATETQDADIHLLADNAVIRPTVSSKGIRGFVVPAVTRRVWLKSHRVGCVDPCTPYLGPRRYFGVRVSALAIRSRVGEVVIPADDPRLITGWYAAEQSEAELWRWTNGSAELPWDNVSGPAVITIWCKAPGGYPVGDDGFSPGQTENAIG